MSSQTWSLIKIILILFFFSQSNVFGQKEGNIWYFGVNAGVDFNSGNPIPLTNSSMNTNEGCASVSDAGGNLLFYTNGDHVWNASHALMPNGTGLMGDPSNTQCIIVKQPGQDSLYYIFTTAHPGTGPFPFGYSVVDMSLNGGLGDVTQKNVALFGSVTEKVTAIPHANGVEIWVLTHELETSVFRAYLLSCDGIDTVFVPSNIGIVHSYIASTLSPLGYLKASPNGDKVACAVRGGHMVEVFDFDNSSGVLSNPLQLTNLYFPYSLEFPPDGSKLYVSDLIDLLQFDLSAPSAPLIIASADTVPLATIYLVGALQLAPDGNIYISRPLASFLSGITNPNNLVPTAGFVDSLLYLNGPICNMGLPPLYPISPENEFSFYFACPGDTIFFSGTYTPQPDSVRWDFGDPGSGADNQSNLLNPHHVYANPGSYQTCLIAYRACLIDTVKEIVVVDSILDLGPDSSICDQTMLFLDAGLSGGQYLWSTGDTTSSTVVNSSGLYWVETSIGSCLTRDSIQITFSNSPFVDLGGDSTFCNQTSFQLDAGNPGATHLWSTGANGQLVSVDSSGLYWVEVSENGCSSRDSIQLIFDSSPSIELGPDTSLCGDSILLSTNISLGSHLWSTGEMTSNIWVSDAGTYSVQITGLCESLADSIQITLGQLPLIRLEDTIRLCGSLPEILSPGNTGVSFSWQQSFNGINWQEISTEAVFTIFEPGQYQLEATNTCGSSVSPFFVEIDPDSGYFVPNVFSPNGDQINDEFNPSIGNPEGYSLSIFDRWGKLMFHTTAPDAGWNGLYRGRETSEGAYFYVLRVRSCFGKLMERKGSLTLVR